LSPVLFNCYINELVERLNETGLGVQVGKQTIDGLLYADDVVLMAETPEDLQKMIDVVEKFNQKWRMSLNIGMSKAMIIDSPHPKSPPRWEYRGKPVEIVKKYKYLGIWFTDKLTWDVHIEYMLDKAEKRSQSLRPLITNNRIPVKAKIMVWLSVDDLSWSTATRSGRPTKNNGNASRQSRPVLEYWR